MRELPDYAKTYPFLSMRRECGVLEVRWHRDDGPVVWDRMMHQQLPMAFDDIAADPANRVVLLTGTGSEFSKRLGSGEARRSSEVPQTGWNDHDRLAWEGHRLLRNYLDIEVPIVAAVNGPATVHAEIPLLADVVIADTTATFGDTAHLDRGIAPGDGSHVVWPLLLGPARGRHLLWTRRVLSASEAEHLGLVAEVVEPDRLADRAWEIARDLATLPRLTARTTRALLTAPIKAALADSLHWGLAAEGISVAAARAEARAREND
jgi:enoyl-CoA hydratase/carnithine racemase